MDAVILLFSRTLAQVWGTFVHNWPFLVVSVLLATALKLYLNPDQVAAFLTRYRRAGVLGATAAAVGTPLCSCGTTAVILGMIASTMPWAPVVAFMVASPLSSPEGLVYSAGLFGWPFALMYFITSIVLGLLGGAVAEVFESRGWLKNQARFSGTARAVVESAVSDRKPVEETGRLQPAPIPVLSNYQARDIRASRPVLLASSMSVAADAAALSLSTCCAPAAPSCDCGGAVEERKPAPVEISTCGCSGSPAPVVASTCGCSEAPTPVVEGTCGCSGAPAPVVASTCGCSGAPAAAAPKQPVTLVAFLKEAFSTGIRLLPMFFGFAFIGYLLNGLIPQEWVAAIFGSGNIYSVPLAATLGLPLYINSEGSLPLVRAMMESGMSQGAAMAFLITGSGTSIGAITGALTIARWRVIALVVGTLWVGSVVMGTLYNILIGMGVI